MIVVTGAAGFIGSNIVADLEERKLGPIVAVDWFGTDEKWRNLSKHTIAAFVRPEALPQFLDLNAREIRAIIHMGAISATTERDVDRLVALNIQYSVDLWDWCTKFEVPFIYASSAATYGPGKSNFDDDDSLAALSALRPLNAYGWSKKAVDQILAQRIVLGSRRPPQWIGLKFFNVYGPNEYHKDDMRSVVAKIYDDMQSGKPARLFKSYREDVPHGEQMRDFIFVKDCSRSILSFLDKPSLSGIFNLGTGKARSFLDIVKALGRAMNILIEVEYIEMPVALRDRYQYFTQANISKLIRAGIDDDFVSLEDGIEDYVLNYLACDDRYR